MSNERDAFEAWYSYSFRGCRAMGNEGYALERYDTEPFQYVQEHPHARYRAFQAGAEWQQEQDKRLVEALEVLARLGNSDGNVIAQMALAAYHAAMRK